MKIIILLNEHEQQLIYVMSWVTWTYGEHLHKTSSRIDDLFAPKIKLCSVLACDIGSITISDHAPVYLKFTHGQAQQCSKRSRFNTHLLNYPHFISYFQTEFQIFYTSNNTPEVSPSILWETCKAYSRGLIISHEKSKKVSRGTTEAGTTTF